VLSAVPSPENLRDCARLAVCGDAAVVPAGYMPGDLRYEVSASHPTTAVLNEAYYAGWTAEACNSDGCKTLDASRSVDGLIGVSLPTGNYALHVQYHAPGRTEGWVFFAVGVAVLALVTLVRTNLRPRRETGSRRLTRAVYNVPEDS
jgi:hypothetical protein